MFVRFLVFVSCFAAVVCLSSVDGREIPVAKVA